MTKKMKMATKKNEEKKRPTKKKHETTYHAQTKHWTNYTVDGNVQCFNYFNWIFGHGYALWRHASHHKRLWAARNRYKRTELDISRLLLCPYEMNNGSNNEIYITNYLSERKCYKIIVCLLHIYRPNRFLFLLPTTFRAVGVCDFLFLSWRIFSFFCTFFFFFIHLLSLQREIP